MYADTALKAVIRSRISMKSAGAGSRTGRSSSDSQTLTSSSGCSKGRGSRRTASTTEKMALAPPIPRARIATTSAA
jgi:hypothetical protein